MDELKKDLEMSSSQKNIKQLKCLGCKIIVDELFSLNVDGKVILICSDCKESLQAILEKEDYFNTVSIVQQQFKEGIKSNRIGDSSASNDFGFFDKIRYVIDHQDC